MFKMPNSKTRKILNCATEKIKHKIGIILLLSAIAGLSLGFAILNYSIHTINNIQNKDIVNYY